MERLLRYASLWHPVLRAQSFGNRFDTQAHIFTGRPRAGAVAVAEIQMQMPLDNERRAVIIGANVNAPMVIRRHAPVVNRRRAPRQAPDRNLERQVAPVRDNARERQALGLPVMYAGRVVAVNAAAVNGAGMCMVPFDEGYLSESGMSNADTI